MDITHELQDQEQEELIYIGFWIRVAASLIDTIMLFGVILLLGLTFALTSSVTSEPSMSSGAELLVNIGIAAGYIMLWLKYGGTPGKRLLSARIVCKDGSPLTTGKAIVRYLSYFLSTIVFGLGFIWVAFDKQKRGWHDIIAGTVVVQD